jgi:hypothetical protein
MNRERAEQQRLASRTGRDVPQPHRADHLATLCRDQRQAASRQPAFAQPLRGLGEARGAVSFVEQSLARRDVSDLFFPNGHHDPLLCIIALRRTR